MAYIHIALMMEAVRTSETSVCSNETTRAISQMFTFHSQHRENLKSHKLLCVEKIQRAQPRTVKCRPMKE
jgi:hypothetical protein